MKISPPARVRVGDRVRVRRQRWIVTDIRTHDNCAAMTLLGLGPMNTNHQRQVLTPFDTVEPLAVHRSFRIVRPTRWRRACRQLIADTGPAGILRTARTAWMDLMPHQLEPALSIVHGRGTRILIADEVGLGKTVQAGLIVAELIARGAVTRVLMLSPAGLKEQWVEEFLTRFNLRAVSFDTTSLVRHRAALPTAVNPWSVEPLVVTSIDFVKRPEVRRAVTGCRWDIVVVDEAHHATSGTDRHDVVADLCAAAPYVVLLSATPHNGDVQAFKSLCALGQHDDDLLMFRRTRADIGMTRQRRVHQLRIRPTPAERTMHAALDTFVRAVQHEPSGRDAATWLSLSILRKRALSSAFALQRSVERRLQGMDVDNDPLQQLALPLFDAADDVAAADAVPAWTIPALRDLERERDLLSRVATAARRAIGRESKLAALDRLLRRIHEPVIVFTEYRDTLGHLSRQVAPNAALLHGGLSREERRGVLATVRQGRVLLATDAAGEGLNLHHACRVVVNLELPWNPMRLEQRIGRVDRIGQTRRVHAFHLIGSGTAEMRVLQKLSARLARAQHDLGISDPLGDVRSTGTKPEFSTYDMKREAAQEHRRLDSARRLMPHSVAGSVEITTRLENHPLVTFCKRRGIRTRLPTGALVILRSVLASDLGQAIADHLIPISIGDADRARSDFDTLDRIANYLFSDGEYQQWLASSEATHVKFWTLRTGREESLQDHVARAQRLDLQPGLFDLRADHAWAAANDERREAIESASMYVTQARQTAVSIPGKAQIALVLFTR